MAGSWDQLRDGTNFFREEGNLYEALRKLAARLRDADLDYAVIGGMALMRHGYRRYTEDIDLLMSKASLDRFRNEFIGRGYVPLFPGASKSFRDAEHKVRIEVITTGEFPGDGEPKPVAFPDPVEARIDSEGIWLITLEKLIELKLASGMSAAHRLRDLGDVVDMIVVRSLPRDFAQKLDPSVRAEYLRLWEAAQARPL